MMQIILNGKSCRSHRSLSVSTVWHVVEQLETHGWRKVVATDSLISLVK